MKKAYKLRSDTELAEFLGIPQPTLATQKSRNSLNIELIIEKCNDLNTNWLLNGEEPIWKKELNQAREDIIEYSPDQLLAQLQVKAADLTKRVQKLDIPWETKLEMIEAIVGSLEIGVGEAEKKLGIGGKTETDS